MSELSGREGGAEGIGQEAPSGRGVVEPERFPGDAVLRERVRGMTQAPSREEQDAHDAKVRAKAAASVVVPSLGEDEQLAAAARVLPQDLGGEAVPDELKPRTKGRQPKKGTSGTPIKRLSEEQWNLLLESYKAFPFKHKLAAERAGVHVETAEKAWFKGISYATWGEVPISRLIEQHQRDARAIIQQKYTAEEEARIRGEIEKDRLAQEQAAEARVDEGLMLQFGRKNTRNLLGAQAAMIPGLRLLADRIGEAMKVMFAEGKVLSVKDIKEALQLIEKGAVTIRHLSAATETLIESERMFMGEVGKRNLTVVMTPEQAMEELARGKRALDFATPRSADEIEAGALDITDHKFNIEGA